jgi:hypothetical protein
MDLSDTILQVDGPLVYFTRYIGTVCSPCETHPVRTDGAIIRQAVGTWHQVKWLQYRGSVRLRLAADDAQQ